MSKGKFQASRAYWYLQMFLRGDLFPVSGKNMLFFDERFGRYPAVKSLYFNVIA